ncbi:hypothetical protein [Xanthomonas campestris]|uniref:hypothetical protein n=1 Tax=Xanthomonas campestris TaxID=339 RepID=UPI003CF16AC0
MRNGDGRYSNALYLQVVDDEFEVPAALARRLAVASPPTDACTAHHAFLRVVCGHPDVA